MGMYNYFRLVINKMRRTGEDSIQYCANIGDLNLYDSSGEIVSLIDGATYAASSWLNEDDSSSSYPPEYAFDNDPSLFWHTDYLAHPSAINWIQIQLPSAVEVTTIGIVPAKWQYVDYPEDFDFLVSNDGINWKAVCYVRGETDGWEGGVERQFEVDYSLLTKVYYAKEIQSTYGHAIYPNNIYGSSSVCYLHGSNKWIYRAFLKHDLSGIPYKSKIISAKLYVYCCYLHDNGASATHNITRVMSDWNEDTLTWNNKPEQNTEMYLDEYVSSPDLNTWGSWDITRMVQEWVDKTYPNYGLQFVNSNEGAYRTEWRFYTKEANNGLATYIEIEYEPQEEYRISKARVEELADDARRLCGITDELSPKNIHNALSSLNIDLQEKVVTPTTVEQEIIPDDGFYGISKLTVKAVGTDGLAENARVYYVGNAKTTMNFTNLNIESAASGTILEES